MARTRWAWDRRSCQPPQPQSVEYGRVSREAGEEWSSAETRQLSSLYLPLPLNFHLSPRLENEHPDSDY
jgi:hypothetical protein